MVKAKNSSDDINLFETGYIMLAGTRFDVEEISINRSRDLTPYHVAAQKDPISQRPGKTKIDFSFKRAFSSTVLAQVFDHSCVFEMILMNNDPATPEPVCTLTGCRLSQDNIGPINGSDVVTEDLQGSATGISWAKCKLGTIEETNCKLKC